MHSDPGLLQRAIHLSVDDVRTHVTDGRRVSPRRARDLLQNL